MKNRMAWLLVLSVVLWPAAGRSQGTANFSGTWKLAVRDVETGGGSTTRTLTYSKQI